MIKCDFEVVLAEPPLRGVVSYSNGCMLASWMMSSWDIWWVCSDLMTAAHYEVCYIPRPKLSATLICWRCLIHGYIRFIHWIWVSILNDWILLRIILTYYQILTWLALNCRNSLEWQSRSIDTYITLKTHLEDYGSWSTKYNFCTLIRVTVYVVSSETTR